MLGPRYRGKVSCLLSQKEILKYNAHQWSPGLLLSTLILDFQGCLILFGWGSTDLYEVFPTICFHLHWKSKKFSNPWREIFEPDPEFVLFLTWFFVSQGDFQVQGKYFIKKNISTSEIFSSFSDNRLSWGIWRCQGVNKNPLPACKQLVRSVCIHTPWYFYFLFSIP